jgi:alcohol dehydrogenase (NADP+)
VGTAVIPKSTNAERIQENLQSSGVNLNEEDLQDISELDRHFRYVNGEFFVTKGNSYSNIFDEDDYREK